MKSQLLQSCQGCAPSTIGPILTFPTGKEKSQNDVHIPIFFKERSAIITPLKHSENEFSPLGGWLGRGLQSAVFLPPTADFFYGQRPLFEPCRLLSSCKAWRWGWWRRHGGKLVFRLASPTVPKKAKPTTAAMAFCIYINHK